MYDILINKNGTARLHSGDLRQTSIEQYLSQKIYKAIMELNPDYFSSINENNRDRFQDYIAQYFNDYFISDGDIDPQSFRFIINNPGSKNQSINCSIEYQTQTAQGKVISFRSDLNYSLTSGAISSVNYNPAYLYTRRNPKEVDVMIKIEIDTYTNEIQVPVIPSIDLEGEIDSDPILLLAEVMTDNINEPRYLDFEINTDTIQSSYVISHYVSGLNRHTDSIHKLVNVTTDLNCTVMEQDGELLIKCGEAGVITGTVEVLTAIQISYLYSFRNTSIYESIYPLKPSRGDCIIHFDKTIPPGTYFIKYKGITE